MRPWGSIRLDIYGGSHEKRMGLTMELPKGLRLDGEIISRDIERRRGVSKKGVTSRTEADVPIYISGVRGGVTTGDTLRVEFENSDFRPKDYADISSLPRPSHCDYPAYIKYGGIPSGGGIFSGRMTLPLVFAGAVARQLLMQRGMTAGGHYYNIGGALDSPFDPLQVDRHTLDRLRGSDFPVLDVSARRGHGGQDRRGGGAGRFRGRQRGALRAGIARRDRRPSMGGAGKLNSFNNVRRSRGEGRRIRRGLPHGGYAW